MYRFSVKIELRSQFLPLVYLRSQFPLHTLFSEIAEQPR